MEFKELKCAFLIEFESLSMVWWFWAPKKWVKDSFAHMKVFHEIIARRLDFSV